MTRGNPAALANRTSVAMVQSTKQNASSVEKIALRIDEASHASGISRSQLYAEMAEGRLRSVKVAGRRLILRDDLMAFLGSGSSASPQKAVA